MPRITRVFPVSRFPRKREEEDTMNPVRFACATLAVALLTGLTGCGSSVDFVRMDPTVYPKKNSNDPVEVFQGSVVRPHVVIGVATASREMKATTGSVSSYDAALYELKALARELGGDALVGLKPVYTEDTSDKPKVELTAKVVKFLEKEATISAH